MRVTLTCERRNLKILLTGSHTNYNLEFFVKRALENLGHQVEFVGYQQDKSVSTIFRVMLARSNTFRKSVARKQIKCFENRLRLILDRFEADLFLVIKGEMIDGKFIESIGKEYGIRTILWFPDDPRFFNSLVRHVACYYDYIFTKSDVMIPRYKEANAQRVYSLAFACDPAVHVFKPFTPKSKRVSFIGAYDNRRGSIVKSLHDGNIQIYGPYWSIFYKGRGSINPAVWGEAVANVYNSSKMGLNVHVWSDLDVAPNMRTFEIPACGTLMLTDRVRGIENYYDVGKEILCYNDVKDLKELIDYYSEMHEERESISIKGYHRTIANHTYDHRMKQMLSLIK